MGNARSPSYFFLCSSSCWEGALAIRRRPLRICSLLLHQRTPAPQPEAPKKDIYVIVENNRLSVEFVNVNFGEIILTIGQKAGIRLKVSASNSSARK